MISIRGLTYKAVFKLIFFWIVSNFCFIGLASAQNNQTVTTVYGPEWTFHSSDLDPNTYIEPIFEKIVQKAKNKYQGRIQFVHNGFILDEKLFIKITVDPGVLEVQAHPLTVAEWQKYEHVVQELLFDVMIENGFVPHEREGAGHINIGTKALLKHRNLAFNFLLDFLSQPGVGIALNSEWANQEDAKNIYDYVATKVGLIKRGSALTAEDIQQPAFKSLFNAILKGARNLNEDQFSYEKNSELVEFISYLEQKFTSVRIRNINIGLRDNHNFLDMDDSEARLEVRQLRPQANMRQYIKLIQLFEARLNYLNQYGFDRSQFNQKIIYDGWQALGEYADYVEETGLKWEEYIDLLPEVWKKLDKKNFVRKKRASVHRAVRCEALF